MAERNTVRSYCKFATVNALSYVDIEFTDTADNRIMCNWFRVDCSATPLKDISYYIVTPSGRDDRISEAGEDDEPSELNVSLYAGFASAIDVIANASSGPKYADDGLGNITVSYLLQNTASGIGGVIGIPGRDPVEMNWYTPKLSSAGAATTGGRAGGPIGVRIWNITKSRPHALFTITYGNVKHANRRKDSDDIFWPPGD